MCVLSFPGGRVHIREVRARCGASNAKWKNDGVRSSMRSPRCGVVRPYGVPVKGLSLDGEKEEGGSGYGAFRFRGKRNGASFF